MPAPLLVPIATRLAGSFAMKLGGKAAAKAAMRAAPSLVNFALGPGSKALGSALGTGGKAFALGAGINAATGATKFLGSSLAMAVPAYTAINAFIGQGGENGISFGKVMGASMIFNAAPSIGKAAAIAAGVGMAVHFLNQNNAAQLGATRQMVLDSANGAYTNHLNAVAQRMNIPVLGNIINAPALAAQQNLD